VTNNQPNTAIVVENLDDDEDQVSWGLLGGEDTWEVGDFQTGINDRFPGWYLIKMPSYSSRTFQVVRDWLADDNVHFGSYEAVGWDSGCSYGLGVVFESAKDAMIFKLRWR
jgi:hypothetical protein